MGRGYIRRREGTRKMWTRVERFLGDHNEGTHRTFSYAQRHRKGGEQSQSVPEQTQLDSFRI